MDNILLLSDSYKVSHWRQYPPGTTHVYSYFESRGCDREGWHESCFFGLQYFLKRYLVGQVVTQEKINEAEQLYASHFNDASLFYKAGWQYILDHHGGRLPVKIKAVPEGTVLPLKTVLMTVVNTDPNCFWLTNFLETLLVQVWYPMTVATNSRYQKMSIQHYLEATGCEDFAPPNGCAFKLHDFGFRGVSSVESAAIGGLGHLVNFLGTDTVAAVVAACKFYGAEEAMGYSIPASEHSTITSWGVDGEVEAMRNMLEQYPSNLVACVSDSFDIYRACRDYWGGELKDLIKGRITENSFGRLVVRPDSGDPTETCVAIIDILCQQFQEDVRITSTGHKLLPDYIRVIQGDGVDYESIPKILQALADAGFAADNIGFGSGGALLQKVNRDTLKMAFKCSEIVVNGEAREVFKDPITDSGKASKKGRLTLQPIDDAAHFPEEARYVPRQGDHGVAGGTGFLHFSTCGRYVTIASGQGDESRDLLMDVFQDGDLLEDWTLTDIRLRADIDNGPFIQGQIDQAAPAPVEYVDGEKVDIWSQSQQNWLEGEIAAVGRGQALSGGQILEPGWYLVEFHNPLTGSSQHKFIEPESVDTILRKVEMVGNTLPEMQQEAYFQEERMVDAVQVAGAFHGAAVSQPEQARSHSGSPVRSGGGSPSQQGLGAQGVGGGSPARSHHSQARSQGLGSQQGVGDGSPVRSHHSQQGNSPQQRSSPQQATQATFPGATQSVQQTTVVQQLPSEGIVMQAGQPVHYAPPPVQAQGIAAAPGAPQSTTITSQGAVVHQAGQAQRIITMGAPQPAQMGAQAATVSGGPITIHSGPAGTTQVIGAPQTTYARSPIAAYKGVAAPGTQQIVMQNGQAIRVMQPGAVMQPQGPSYVAAPPQIIRHLSPSYVAPPPNQQQAMTSVSTAPAAIQSAQAPVQYTHIQQPMQQVQQMQQMQQVQQMQQMQPTVLTQSVRAMPGATMPARLAGVSQTSGVFGQGGRPVHQGVQMFGGPSPRAMQMPHGMMLG